MDREALAAEHRRLVLQFRQLRLEHAAIRARPFDRSEHVIHRGRLRAEMADLQRHLTALGAERRAHAYPVAGQSGDGAARGMLR